jgi:SH3 domain protein
MYRLKFILGVVLGLCMMSQLSWAQKAYVTDTLKITLRTGPSVENKIIEMLTSGQVVEVMDSLGDWSHVRLLENGESTKEGWLLSRFLITRLPWEVLARSLIEENTGLQEKLIPAEIKMSEALSREQKLTTKLRDTTEALRKLGNEYESLKQGSKGYLKLKDTHRATRSELERLKKDFRVVTEENRELRSSQRNKWFATGAIVLLCGLLIGLVLGRQQKKRRTSLQY